MKNIQLLKTNFFNFVTSKIDLTKLKYISNSKQFKAYPSQTLRKDNINFLNKEYFFSCVKYSVDTLMNSYNQKYRYSIEIRGVWEHEYENNDFQEDHIHANRHFSFVIYVKGKSGTVFKNPIGYLLQAMYHDFDDNLGEYYFEPSLEQGDMIVFPSYIPHFVKKQSNCKTIAGDILIKRM